jgi:uncharacterized protein (TIGR03663 family)
MRELAESQSDSFLKRPIASWLRLDVWMLAVTLIMMAAIVTRLWDLGSRAYNHDEAIHAWESWKLYTGQGYVHSPIYHGPFLYHATAFIYFLFGHSDYTGRLSAALFGIGTIGLIFFLRRWLGSRGTLVAAALAVISPALMYYGRFIRHDAYSVFFTLLMFLGILNYLEKRQDKYLYLTVLGQALYFSNMETAFIQTFVFWTFLAGLLLYQWLPDRSRPWREFPTFDLLIVIGTLLAPLASPLALKVAGAVLRDPLFILDYSTPAALAAPSIARAAIIWGIFLIVSVAIGIWWDRRRWPTAAGIYYAIYIVLFTTFFTNGKGLATGQVGSLGYWLSQHEVRRGSQPWHYYLVVLSLYEYLPLLFGIIGGVFYFLRRRRDATASEAPEVAVTGTAPFTPLVIYWSVLNLVIFSWAGEKMPWLSVHLTLPLILLTGWFAGHLLAGDWRSLLRQGGAHVAVLLPLAIVAAIGALSSRPFRGTSLGELNATMNWVAGVALLLIAGLPLVHYVGELGWRRAGRVAVVVLFAFLAISTVRHAWMAVFKYGDVAVETLIYAQASPDPPMVMRELEFMSRRLTGGEKDLHILYDDESSWPFVWYFRDWPNAHYYHKSPAGPVDAAVVIVGPGNEAGVKPLLGDHYYRRQYRLIWWPMEDYKTLTPAKAWHTLTDPVSRKSLWDIIMYRKYDTPLASWPLVNTFAMYVRKDIAVQLWDYGPEVAGPAAELPEDPYLTRYQPLMARRSIGPGQLEGPKGMAVDEAGRLYVADSGRHCIQVFDRDGMLVAQWGTQGSGPGQFQEPWGVAVGPGGVVYVADTWNHRIQKFDATGAFLTEWGVFADVHGRASEPGDLFYGPRGVAVDAEGNVWVTDTGNKRVCKFDPHGVPLAQYGGAGSGDGQFQEPVGIAIDSQGHIYVADVWNRRVQVFDSEFRYLRQWPVRGWEGQSVTNKPYLAVDVGGDVYVTDPDAYRVIRFSGEGEVVAVWGKRGTDLTSFGLPIGIAVGPQGQVWVSDSGNGRVSEFVP